MILGENQTLGEILLNIASNYSPPNYFTFNNSQYSENNITNSYNHNIEPEYITSEQSTDNFIPINYYYHDFDDKNIQLSILFGNDMELQLVTDGIILNNFDTLNHNIKNSFKIIPYNNQGDLCDLTLDFYHLINNIIKDDDDNSIPQNIQYKFLTPQTISSLEIQELS